MVQGVLVKRFNQKGFTIIELLIATVVFSVILLVITAAIIQFSRLYYKGTITSRTQETARIISQDISQTIQFSGSKPQQNTGTGVICVGNTRYTYRLKQQINSSNAHALIVDKTSDECNINIPSPELTDADPSLPDNTFEFIGERMQLVNILVDENPDDSGLYQVTVRVAYGNNEDFIGDSPDNSCRPIIVGGQFCAVSELTTTVTRRVD